MSDWKTVLLMGLLALPAGVAASAAEAPPASGVSPAQSLGLYPYPRNGQSASKQGKDEKKCYSSAKKQTGIDPAALASSESARAAAAESTPKGGTVRGSARGAAGGAAIGAITGNAGTGAAVGATVGAVRGRHQQRAAEEQSAQGADQARAQTLDTFKRSFSACLDAKGYSVK
jgi:hypothetical protein